jgi:hypothetical protein
MRYPLNQFELPGILCWTSGLVTNPSQTLGDAIKSQYRSSFPALTVQTLINPPADIIDAPPPSPTPARTLFHFLIGRDHKPRANIEALTRQCPFAIHVVDGGDPSQLVNCYQSPTVAFLSPSSLVPGFPLDLLSSFLTTPIQTALHCHSAAYHGFTGGPLRPLTVDQCRSAPAALVADLLTYLHELVRAMAAEVIKEEELYATMFQDDPVLADLTAHFFLAAHFMLAFDVRPASFPPLPDLSTSVLWDAFAFRLDMAVTCLNTIVRDQSMPSSGIVGHARDQSAQMAKEGVPSSGLVGCVRDQSAQMVKEGVPSSGMVGCVRDQSVPGSGMIGYVRDAVQSLDFALSGYETSFQYPLAHLPTILADGEFAERGCELLLKFMEKDRKTAKVALRFPLLPPLFRLFTQGSANAGYCLAAVLSVFPAAGPRLLEMSPNFFRDVVFPLLRFRADNRVSVLMLATLLVQRSPALARDLAGQWAPALELLSDEAEEVRFWALLFVRYLVESVADRGLARERLCAALEDDFPHVRIMSIVAVSALGRCADDADLFNQIFVGAVSDLGARVRAQAAFSLRGMAPGPQKESVLSWTRDDPLVPALTQNPDWAAVACGAVLGASRLPSVQMRRPPHLEKVEPLLLSPNLVAIGAEARRTITSNIVNSLGFLRGEGESAVTRIIGTQGGEICCLKWPEAEGRFEPVFTHVADTSIVHIEHIMNGGFPLTFASDRGGYIWVLKDQELSGGLELVDCLPIATQCISLFEVSESDRLLASVRGATTVQFYDLVRLKEREKIRLTTCEPVNAIHTLPRLPGAIALAGDKGIDLFDLRGRPSPVVTC